MSKLVDKTQLSNLAKKLDQRAKDAVTAEQTRATGIEQGLQTSINAINNETTGILAKAKEYADGLNKTSSTDITSLQAKDSELQAAIEAESTARTAAINKLNGTAETEGSVAKSIKDALDPVKADVTQAKSDITALQGSVANNAKAVTDGDAATLKSAKAYADKAISDLVDSAPEDRNTLNKLSEAIKANKDVYDGYVTTVNTALAKKVDKVEGSRLITDKEAKEFAAKAEAADVTKALETAKTFTTDEIAKVNSANTALGGRVGSLETLVGKDAEGENPATGLVKNVADLQAKNVSQDTAIEGAQSTADSAVSAAAAAQKQADKGVTDAATAQAGVDALKTQLGAAGTSGISKDVKDNKAAIDAINNAETGILAQGKKYTDGKIDEVTTKVTANTTAISKEQDRAKKAEKANADALAKLNGTSETEGSVAKSISDALADYSNTANMKAFVASVVNTLALSMEDDKVKLKLGGVDGVTLTETSLDLCTDADIEEIITGLDAAVES